MEEWNGSDSFCTIDTDSFHRFICTCYSQSLDDASDDLTLQQRDYLRQNVMVPLAWAMAKALKHRPTDPIHYIAYQLLRWSTGTVSETEKENVHKFVASSTITMDARLRLVHLSQVYQNRIFSAELARVLDGTEWNEQIYSTSQ